MELLGETVSQSPNALAQVRYASCGGGGHSWRRRWHSGRHATNLRNSGGSASSAGRPSGAELLLVRARFLRLDSTMPEKLPVGGAQVVRFLPRRGSVGSRQDARSGD